MIRSIGALVFTSNRIIGCCARTVLVITPINALRLAVDLGVGPDERPVGPVEADIFNCVGHFPQIVVG